MNFSFTGFFTLLACLALPFLRLRQSLMLVACASFIGSYAIGGIDGDAHVLPGPILGVCYCAWLAVRVLLRGLWRVPPFPGKGVLLPFIAYAVLVTVGAPLVFGGSISVVQPGQVSEGIREAAPLQFTSSSVAQLAYVVFDAVLLCAAVRAAQRPGFSSGWPVRVFLWIATALAAAVVAEAILNVAGVPLDLFGMLMGESFDTLRPDRYALDAVFGLPIRRAQAIFGEPSFYSVFMTGAFGAALIRLRARPRVDTLACMATIAVGLMLSFSTTAIVALGVVAVMAVFVPINARPGATFDADAARRSRRNRRLFLIAFGVIALALVVALLKSDAVFDYLFGKLTDTEGYESGNYSSGAERLYWDITAAMAMVQSYGIGIGAGATRASSFLLNTGAAYGVIGLLVVAIVVGMLVRALYRRASYADDADVRAAIVMWLGWFIALAFSVPDGFAMFYVWIHLGFVLAMLARERWTMPRWWRALGLGGRGLEA